MHLFCDKNILHYMRKPVRIVMYVVCVVAVILIVVLFVGANFMFKFALDPKAEEELLVVENPGESDESLIIEPTPEEKWLFESCEHENITSHDGFNLHAYFVPAEKPSDKYAVLVHGYKSAAGALASYAKHYYDKGWNVLVPDQRAHGFSEGRYIGMGWHEHYDVLAWTELLVSKNKDARILLHGVSMGAATVMLVSGEEDLPVNIRAVIEDCGYSSINAQFADQLKKSFGLPVFPLLQFASLVTKLRAGYFFGEGNCVEAVSNSVTPTLFIHGSRDTFVPFKMLDELYNASSSKKQKLVVQGAEHANAMAVNPELYWTTVDKFVVENGF